MHYRLGRELKALSKIFTLVGILVNVFLLYHYLENEYFLRMKIYYTVVFIFLMILLWVFGKVINGVGVMLTTQGKMLHEPKLEEPEDEDSIKSTFLAFCHAFKKNKKAFASLIVVCVILLGGGIYAKVNYDIQHAYDGIWYLEGNLEGDTFFINGDEVYFYEINDYENREVSLVKSQYKGKLKKDKVEFYSYSYDYTSDNEYKTKRIDKTIYLTRLSNVEFKVDGKTYNRASK